MTATDILSGRAPFEDDHDPVRTRGGGCKMDGGPLWVTVELEDHPEIGGSDQGGDEWRTVWGRIFQKGSTHAKKTGRRSRRSSRYAEVGDYDPRKEKKSDLVECMALQLCTASAPS